MSMSECTAAGVEVLNSFDATMTAEDEELLLQQRILQSKAMDDRRARQRAEEELKFARHKIADRDRKLEDARTRLAAQSSQITTLQKQLDTKESANAALKAQVYEISQQMERSNSANLSELKDLRESLAASRLLSGSAMLTGSNSTESSSKLTRQGSISSYIAEKAKNLGLKRKFKGVATYHEQASRAMECALMEEADLHSVVTERCLTRGVKPINDLLKAEMGIEVEAKTEDVAGEEGIKRQTTLVSYDGLKRYGRGNNNVLSFNEPLDCKMPEDVFIDAKVSASSYNTEYTDLRKSIHSLAKNFKKDSDNALNGLWFIFTEKDKGPRTCVLANPKEDFQKELRAALAKTKTNLLDLIRGFNTHLKTILGNERRIKQQWLTEQRPVRHMEVQADIPPPEDPRIAELQEEVAFLKQRQAAIHEEHSVKSQDLEMHREKAEVNMQFLQGKVFSLHTAVHTALHSVYKHRFHWGPRCPNHFAPLTQDKKAAASKKRQLEVGYNVLLGQAIDMEIKSLGQFADYFVSDQLFGVDLAAAFNPVSTKEQDSRDSVANGGSSSDTATALVMRKKEAVPMKKSKVDQARKLSTQLDTMLREEKAIETTSAATASAAATSPPTRTLFLSGDKENGKGNSIAASAAPTAFKARTVITPPPTSTKPATTAAPFANLATQQQNGSARRSSVGSSNFVPSCATRTSSSSTAKRSTLNVSPPNNTHIDAAAAAVTRPAGGVLSSSKPSASPIQVSALPTTTINMELDVGAAPPRGSAPNQGGGQRFQNNRRTVGGFVAFAQ